MELTSWLFRAGDRKFFMRKKPFIIAIIITLFFSTPFSAAAQTAINLDAAIQNTAQDIERRLPQGASIVLVNFDSASAALSDYIIEELTVGLMDSGNLVVIDHNTLNRVLVDMEINLQFSGYVSDETMVSLGRLMGANYALSGSLSGSGDSFRFEAFLTEVRTQRRQSLGARNIQSNERLIALMNQRGRPEPEIPVNPLTADEFYQRGFAYMDRGEYARAIADFTELLRFDNNRNISQDYRIFTAIYMRGLANSNLGNHEEAIADYSRSVDVIGESAAAFTARSIQYSLIRDFDRAMMDINRVMELTPNLPTPYILRCSIYTRKGEYDKALEDALYAVWLDPEHANGHRVLSIAYLAKGELEKAEESYRIAIHLAPNDRENRELMELIVDFYIERAIASSNRGNHNAALADYNRAIGIDPNSAGAYANRGIAYFNLGELNRAVEDMERAVNLASGNTHMTVRNLLAALYIERAIASGSRGNHNAALMDSSRAIALDPNRAGAYANRGMAYFNLGELDRAVADLERAVTLAPDNAQVRSSFDRVRHMRDLEAAWGN